MKLSRQRTEMLIKLLLFAAMLGTVIFIFANSMKSREASTEQSNTVGNIIAEIIPPDTSLGALIQDNLRKIAHFTEYGLLGIEIAVYIFIFEKKRLAFAALSISVPLVVGFIDESIQIFSGRGPSISDVWIDIGGFCFFSALAYAGCVLLRFVYILFRRLSMRRRNSLKKEQTDEEREQENG